MFTRTNKKKISRKLLLNGSTVPLSLRLSFDNSMTSSKNKLQNVLNIILAYTLIYVPPKLNQRESFDSKKCLKILKDRHRVRD